MFSLITSILLCGDYCYLHRWLFSL